MIASQLTAKNQTTIPRKVRDALKLRVHDRLTYEIAGDAVVVRPLRGTILDHFGSVKPRQSPGDVAAVRGCVHRAVAGRRARG